MEDYNHLVALIAMSMGVAWASGINLYAAVLMLGIMQATGNIALPPDLVVLGDPMVIAAAGFMYCVEFFADKTPGVDTGWDALHTFIRVPAGAVLAAGAMGDVNPALNIAAGLIGGGLALGSHSLKSGTRVIINTSPEPVTNWSASVLEDIAVIAGLWTALNHPVLFLVLLVLFVILLVWLLPKLWRAIKQVIAKLKGFFSGKKETETGDSMQFEPAHHNSAQESADENKLHFQLEAKNKGD